MNKTRIAIAGTGPAGWGALRGVLEQRPEAEVTLIDPAGPIAAMPVPADDNPAAAYSAVYREIWRDQPRKFPPPKTHFAQTLPKFEVDGIPRIFRSENIGGLSNYWGGTCLPFTALDLEGWPVTAAEMAPFYAKCTEAIGVSGAADALGEYFGDAHVNRPPIPVTGMMNRLAAAANKAPAGPVWKVRIGVNRVAVETRPDQPSSCVACGECLAGCFRNSVFSTRGQVQRFLKQPNVRLVEGRLLRVRADRELVIARAGGAESIGRFDKVFLAAGCPNTTAVVMRSLGLSNVQPMADNAVFVFPVLAVGRSPRDPDPAAYLSLNNLILTLLPQIPSARYAQALLYTNFDYMWRYNTPPALWPLMRPLVAWSRRRLAWGRLYLHGDDSQAYRIELENDQPVLRYARGVNLAVMADLMAEIRRAVNRDGFWAPPVKPVLQKSNSHYGCTLPYGDRGPAPVSPLGEIMPGLHLCDSSVFPNLPSVSLTFSIMANAWRTASGALKDI